MDKLSISEFTGACNDRDFDLQYDFLDINVGSLIEFIYKLARKCEKDIGEDFVSIVSHLECNLPREGIDIDGFTVGKLLAFSNINLFNKKSTYCEQYGMNIGNKMVYLVLILPFFLQSKLKHISYENVYEKLK